MEGGERWVAAGTMGPTSCREAMSILVGVAMLFLSLILGPACPRWAQVDSCHHLSH